ncbi:MAG TPA: pirin family protein [Alphaproteobacteria bacterium]|nr:quercetin 2,3-dioxygenase [Rhodospirillaceae bacterium]HRJ11642.1 pirin family protein [Alphaproteobacteria bacterium]
MLRHRPAAERGTTQTSWLNGKHTFSFGGYRDPAWVHFGPLRVINEDVVAPGGGFSPHDHQDMEIITIVLDGELAHKDSLGSAATIKPNQIQMMRAGTGIEHSEFNASSENPVHLLQIWIMPHTRGLAPMYQDKMLNESDRMGKWQTVVSPANENKNAFEIAADARLSLAQLPAQQSLDMPADDNRQYWLQIAKGSVMYGDMKLQAGDGLGIKDEPARKLIADIDSEILLFDLAA